MRFLIRLITWLTRNNTQVPDNVEIHCATHESNEVWLNDPSLDTCLPVEFDSGARMDTFSVSCGNCSRTIPLKDVHGSVTDMFTSVKRLEFVSVCRFCLIHEHRKFNLNDHMHLQLVE